MEFALKYTLVRCLKPRTCSIQLWRLQHSNAKRNPNETTGNVSFDNGESGTPVLFFPKENKLVELKSNTLPKNVSDLFNSVEQNALKRKDDKTSTVNHKKSQILDMFKKDPKNEISSDAEISINESPTVTFKGKFYTFSDSQQDLILFNFSVFKSNIGLIFKFWTSFLNMVARFVFCLNLS